MPMHNWKKVKAGVFHNFHTLWLANITNRLNAELLPADYFAMAEQFVGRPEADVVALHTQADDDRRTTNGRKTSVASIKTKTRFVISFPDVERYARKANRIVIHRLGEVVAIIEVVSPGNKNSRRALDEFVDKANDLIIQQVNLLIVDPFPPGKQDPNGIHGAISDGWSEQPYALPPDKPLTMVAYQVAPERTAHIENIAVGDPLPTMPLFLKDDTGIELPLEETYQATWNVLPAELRRLLD